MRKFIEIFICTCLSWSMGAGIKVRVGLYSIILRTMAIFREGVQQRDFAIFLEGSLGSQRRGGWLHS